MPLKIRETTKSFILVASLPQATATYTVISHEDIINKVYEVLKLHNLEIDRELYACNSDATIARGIFHLKSGSDPDMGMSLSWVNSYDKSTKFSCAVSGHINISDALMISSNQGSYTRKHTGDALVETNSSITHQIINANDYYNLLIADKEAMKTIIIPAERRAELMGRLYFINQLITSDQLNVVKREFAKPSFDYGVDLNSLWFFYCSFSLALKETHPKYFMNQHVLFHTFIKMVFANELSGVGSMPVSAIGSVPLPSAQLTIFDAIEEAKQEELGKLTVAEYPVVLQEGETFLEVIEDTTEVVEDVVEEAVDEIPENNSEEIKLVTDETLSSEEAALFEPMIQVPIEYKEEPVVENVVEAPTVMDTLEQSIIDNGGDELHVDAPEIVEVKGEEEPVIETIENVSEVIEDKIDDLGSEFDEIVEGWMCMTCNGVFSFDEVMYDGQTCKDCHEGKGPK